MRSDACHSYFLVQAKGEAPAAAEVDVDLSGAVREYVRAESLDRLPNTGALVATSGRAETHEWSLLESGVFSPLFDARATVLATIAIPTAVAVGVLLALGMLRVVWRWAMKGVFELGRAAVTPTTDHRAIRVRRHGGPSSRAVGARRGPPVKVD